MSDFDDAIGDMVTDLHVVAGRSMTYMENGASLGTLTLSRHRQPSYTIDNGSGGVTEVLPVDFIGKTAALTAIGVTEPKRGQRIVDGAETFEVTPTISEKVFRRIGDQMTRIHTKQIPTA